MTFGGQYINDLRHFNDKNYTFHLNYRHFFLNLKYKMLTKIVKIRTNQGNNPSIYLKKSES